MALDATASEANVVNSVKKFFTDTLVTIEKLQVSFDKSLEAPLLNGVAVTDWVSVQFGQFIGDKLALQIIQIFCCTRQDNEGYRLTQLRDKVVAYLRDETKTDASGRIDLYRTNVSPWVKVGGMLILTDPESGRIEGPDQTKFKVIPIRLRWGMKI